MSTSRRSGRGLSRRSGDDLYSSYESTIRALEPEPARKVRRRPWLTRGMVHAAVAVAVVLVIVAGVSLWSVYRASQQVPEFYAEALAAPPQVQAEAGQELERKALALNSQVRRPGRWEARFTQDQINGWLAVDLPRKFPGSLPSGAADPRVAVTDDELQLAVRFQKGNVNTVFSAAGEAYLTDQPNELAVRIVSVRAGALPVPLARFLDEIAVRAARSGLPLKWTESEGDPVALVKLPLEGPEFRGKRLVLEELRLEEGVIVVAGRTDENTLMTAYPSPAAGSSGASSSSAIR